MAANPNQFTNTVNMDPSNFLWYNPKEQASGLDARLGNNPVLNRQRQEALRQGPSAWAGLQNKQIMGQEGQARDEAARQAAGAAAGARSSMAMQGGLGGGARERIASGQAENMLNMQQKIGANTQNLMGNVGIQDEQNRQQQLQGQGAQEMAKIGMQTEVGQADEGRNIASYDKLNYANLEKHKANMQAWAAGKQATATENSGKK